MGSREECPKVPAMLQQVAPRWRGRGAGRPCLCSSPCAAACVAARVPSSRCAQSGSVGTRFLVAAADGFDAAGSGRLSDRDETGTAPFVFRTVVDGGTEVSHVFGRKRKHFVGAHSRQDFDSFICDVDSRCIGESAGDRCWTDKGELLQAKVERAGGGASNL